MSFENIRCPFVLSEPLFSSKLGGNGVILNCLDGNLLFSMPIFPPLKTTYRIIFSCPVPGLVWTCVKEALDWERIPTYINDLLNNWLKENFRDLLFCYDCLEVMEK
jgi:hypothetical protein